MRKLVASIIVMAMLCVSLPLFTADNARSNESTSWWDSNWKERITLWVNETSGIDQGEFVIDQWFDFSRFNVTNGTKEFRVTYFDEETESEIERPIQIVAERNNGEKCFEARVLFLTYYMDANARHIYHIYLNNPNVATPSPLYTDFNPEVIKNRLLDPLYENNNYDFAGPTDMDIDENENIYIVDRGNHRIQIFDSEMTYLNTIGVSRESGQGNNSFFYPTGIAIVDSKIYVADSNNHRVQIFDQNGNYLQTLGVTGQSGNTDTTFNTPKDVAVDSGGKIYVTDYYNYRIQVFNDLTDNVADRTIGITGVSGTDNSVFNVPYGIAVNNDNIYVSDSANHRIQIFDMTGNWLNTIGQTGVIGHTNNQFFYPFGIDVDSSGKIYVADNRNHRVQIYNSDGSYSDTVGVTAEFGSGHDYLNNPYNVVVSHGKIFVADYENNRVQVYDLDGDYTQTIGSRIPLPKNPTDFNDPRDVTVGSDGRVYVADRRNQRVQIFDSNYTYLQTIGTTGESGDLHTHLYNPYDVDIGADMIAVADAGNDRIQLFDLSGSYLKSLTGTGGNEFDYPCGVKIDDQNDRILVADTYAEKVHVYTKDLTYITTIYGTDPKYTDSGDPTGNITFAHPYDVEIGPNGMIYVLDTDHQAIQVFYGNNYSYSHTLAGGDFDSGNWIGDLKWACGFDLVGDNIYLADTYNHRLKIININGDYVSCIGYNGTSGTDDGHFSRPRGVGVGPDGKIYVADADNNRVQVFYSNLSLFKSISTTGLAIFDNKHLNVPEGMGVDAFDNIYIADSNNYRIQAYDPIGSYLFTLGSSTKREAGSDNDHLFIPAGVAVGNNRIYVADKGNARVQVFHMDGVYDDTLPIDCYDIAIGLQGYIYSAFAPNHCINVHTSAGDYVQTLGTPGASGNDTEHLNFPTGLGVADDGKIYVADSQNHRVVIYNDLNDHIADDFIGVTEESGDDVHHLSNPSTVACWNGKVYVADLGNHRIQIFDTDGDYLGTIGVTGKPGCDNFHFNSPSGVFVGHDGKIYVADRDNNRIVKITYVTSSIGNKQEYKPEEVISGINKWILTLAILAIVATVVIIGVGVLLSKRSQVPVKEDIVKGLPVERGYSYLFKEKRPVKAFNTFAKLSAAEDSQPLLVARTPPSQVEDEYKHKPERMIWLSRVESERDYVEHMSPRPLAQLLDKITTFIEENEKPVVLLEGIEYLISETSFDDALKFMDSITPDIATRKGILIVPVDERTMGVKEFSLLARGLRVVE